MRVSIATFAFLACAGFTSAATECAQKANEKPTAGILAVRQPNATSIVPAGTPYTIVWDKTAGISSVSIVLCIGPSANCVDSACIANGVDNSGSYSWTPPTSLIPTGNSGFGLKIIAAGGDFQYSTQFGISNSNVQSSSSEAPKKTESATLVQEISDGQAQVPTGAVSGTVTKTKEQVTASETLAKSEYAVSTAVSSLSSASASETKTMTKSNSENGTATTEAPKQTSVPLGVYPPKPSSGFITNSANATYLASTHKAKASTEIHTGAGSNQNTTEIIKPSTDTAQQSTFAPITSVAVATAGTTPPPAPVPATPTTTTPIATATGAAQRILAGGMLAGLGAVAAFLL